MHETVRRIAGTFAGALFAAALGCGSSAALVETTKTSTSADAGSAGGAAPTTSAADHDGGAAGGAATGSGGGGSGATDGGATLDAGAGGSGGQGGSPPSDAGAGDAGEDAAVGGCTTDSDCSDHVVCNGDEVCLEGSCAPGVPPGCDDGLSCTTDVCNPETDACAHTPSDGACDDGVACNGVELCNPGKGAAATGCVPGSPPACDDGVACTQDFCQEAAKGCVHVPDDGACSDSFYCTGVETCDVVLGCKVGVVPACDDGVGCTADFCDLGKDACSHVAQDEKCSNGVVCDGVERCDPPVGDVAAGCAKGAPLACDDGIVCTADACDEVVKGCLHTPMHFLCDDGVFCDGVEACDAGVGCLEGKPVVCDDGLSCTADACDEAQKKCAFAPSDAACDDGLYCNGPELCDPSGKAPSGCKAAVPVGCASDGVGCTVDACDEATKTCTHTADHGLCGPNEFCVPVKGGCVSAKPCSLAVECDDGNACNGKETCNVVCQPGVPVNCSDGIQCTTDACDPPTGACTHAPNDAFCDDGFNCNGKESCSAQKGCVTTGSIACDDGVACTLDLCQEPGTCVHAPNDGICDDGKLCNGAEVCTAKGCVAGAPHVCPGDGIACTSEVCDPLTNACKQVADDAKCPCGQTCSPQKGGCGQFCMVSTCQGKVYDCGDCADNDGDCRIDAADSSCLGPCDNTESSYYGGIPGQNNSPCKSDCYFDQDTGSGNDDCYWSHECDPLEVAPAYPPEGSQCTYDANANTPGTSRTCSQLFTTQSNVCAAYCGPLTPNGCDCFGCCVIPGAKTPVWLGSESPKGTGSCSEKTVGDPTLCKPCTQVPSCLNACDHCEVCVGKPLPADCVTQTCPPGRQLCGGAGQSPCPVGQTCITGCCANNPQ